MTRNRSLLQDPEAAAEDFLETAAFFQARKFRFLIEDAQKDARKEDRGHRAARAARQK